MDRIARSKAVERGELFRSAAAVLYPERSPAIIEKDFWVCWALHRVYDSLPSEIAFFFSFCGGMPEWNPG